MHAARNGGAAWTPVCGGHGRWASENFPSTAGQQENARLINGRHMDLHSGVLFGTECEWSDMTDTSTHQFLWRVNVWVRVE